MYSFLIVKFLGIKNKNTKIEASSLTTLVKTRKETAKIKLFSNK